MNPDSTTDASVENAGTNEENTTRADLASRPYHESHFVNRCRASFPGNREDSSSPNIHDVGPRERVAGVQREFTE